MTHTNSKLVFNPTIVTKIPAHKLPPKPWVCPWDRLTSGDIYRLRFGSGADFVCKPGTVMNSARRYAKLHNLKLTAATRDNGMSVYIQFNRLA